ncbi:two-component system response regulator (stage 0 sporulation protein A) [Ruminiclostridium sufflavum DSM 19573]|uniref:Stage 0 sporulation protein A homolog n=1 Tax=Ruminiclostridium sufflavum DSM 19573 TaxID=1121337 RepID=A0A318XI20_9FIRM|nr:response regulator [Ruminiclostridium sufflavum]PYG86674.1 two-component system response regulator (stage 0 sporulation protein A) [Ruminiclostridium sufflavum DSM 19573]
MNKIKVLIADDNVLAAKRLFDKLIEYEYFSVSTARDGIETIEKINNEKPDVVLLDIIMPKLDGVGVLEYAQTSLDDGKPIFIVFSAVSQENYVTRVMNLGASYYILKPFDEAIIATRILQLFSDLKKAKYFKSDKINMDIKVKNPHDDELKVLATKYMRESGLKAHMTGYSYIRDIIVTAFDTYCKTGAMPKGIYRTIADKNKVSVQKVERAIRNCFESVKDSTAEAKLTNSQAICQLIEKIRINN